MKYRASFLRDSVFVLLVVDTLLLFGVFIEWKVCKVRIEGIDFFRFAVIVRLLSKKVQGLFRK